MVLFITFFQFGEFNKYSNKVFDVISFLPYHGSCFSSSADCKRMRAHILQSPEADRFQTFADVHQATKIWKKG